MNSDPNPVPKNLLPDLFEFTLQRSLVDKPREIQTTKFKWLSELQVLELDYGTIAIHSKVSAEQWRIFWDVLSIIKLWKWKSSYINPLLLDDYVITWDLKIKYNGIVLESAGYNAFPGDDSSDPEENEQFDKFVFAVRKLRGVDDTTN